MQVALKVKCESLAQEQRIIRKYEGAKKRAAAWDRKRMKATGMAGDGYLSPFEQERNSLYLHRIQLRPEIRAAHIALGFLRGRTYAEMENASHSYPDWKRVEELILKYRDEGDVRIIQQRFAQWLSEAHRRPLIDGKKAVPYTPTSVPDVALSEATLGGWSGLLKAIFG